MKTDILKIVVDVPAGMRDLEKIKQNILSVHGIEIVIYDDEKWTFWHPETSNINTKDIGEGCVIHSHVWIGKEVKIGKNVRIQSFSFIPDGVIIEDDVFIAPNVIFTNDPDLECKGKKYWKKTLVKKGVKIGAGVCIKAGVTIGKNAKIGMGSVVTKSVPNNQVWAGNPASRISGR